MGYDTGVDIFYDYTIREYYIVYSYDIVTIIIHVLYYYLLYNALSKYVRPLHYYCVHRMKYIFYYIHYNNTIIVLIIIEKRKWEINSRLYCQSLEFVENFLDDLYLRSSHLYYTYIYIYIEVCLQNYVIIMNYSWISSII